MEDKLWALGLLAGIHIGVHVLNPLRPSAATSVKKDEDKEGKVDRYVAPGSPQSLQQLTIASESPTIKTVQNAVNTTPRAVFPVTQQQQLYMTPPSELQERKQEVARMSIPTFMPSRYESLTSASARKRGILDKIRDCQAKINELDAQGREEGRIGSGPFQERRKEMAIRLDALRTELLQVEKNYLHARREDRKLGLIAAKRRLTEISSSREASETSTNVSERDIPSRALDDSCLDLERTVMGADDSSQCFEEVNFFPFSPSLSPSPVLLLPFRLSLSLSQPHLLLIHYYDEHYP